MKKNILVLTGSPRIEGNSDLLANAFIRGANQAGHKVIKFEAGRKNITGCKACDTCYSNGKPCSFDDDFNNIAPHMEMADVIVFITPLYWFTFPAGLKAVIDKMYSFIIGKRELKIKESMLLVCGEADDESVYNGIVKTYNDIACYQNWTDRGHLVVPGVNRKGDILSTKALELAEEMGSTVADL